MNPINVISLNLPVTPGASCRNSQYNQRDTLILLGYKKAISYEDNNFENIESAKSLGIDAQLYTGRESFTYIS